MAKSPRRSTASAPENDPLATAVERLADEVRVLRDVLDAIREDLSWVTRNGVPHQPQTHVLVKRMAKSPLAGDWSQQLELVHLSQPGTPDEHDGNYIEKMTEQILVALEGNAQAQLEIVLTALENVGRQMLAALTKSLPPAPRTAVAELPPSDSKPPPAAPHAGVPPAPGRVF